MELHGNSTSKSVERGETWKKTRVVFDVVNSVKGGSGKSTFSFLLASYHASREHTKAYIIDLDLRGTSWEKNYHLYLQRENDRFIYVNDLMRDFDAYQNQKFFLKLTAEYGGTVPECISFSLCMAKPSVTEEIDELKVDLFENAIFRIIDRIYTDHSVHPDSRGEEQETIHIILDMPPSYEEHAERVLRRLFSDVESRLYRKVEKAHKEKKGKYFGFEPYQVNLYMISAISPAHIELNVSYIKNFIKKQVYSSAVSKLVEDDRFQIRFIGNDVSLAIQTLGLTNSVVADRLKAYIKSEFDRILINSLPVGDRVSFPVLDHLPLNSSKAFFDPLAEAGNGPVPLPPLAKDAVKEVVAGSFGE